MIFSSLILTFFAIFLAEKEMAGIGFFPDEKSKPFFFVIFFSFRALFVFFFFVFFFFVSTFFTGLRVSGGKRVG